MVMVCHDLPDVFAVSDRIVVIRQGHVTGVHRTVETSYEEIIAEIAGVTTEHEYEEIAENPKSIPWSGSGNSSTALSARQ